MNAITRILAAIAALAWLGTPAHAQIYKIVDKDGNVTYTDQAPADGSEPMDLPELQVVETEPVAPLPSADSGASDEPTTRDLRRIYRDFKITRPQQEETFWGTGNQVVVSWGSDTALRPDMSVRLYLDGTPREVTRQSMMAMTLDRGEHTVFAELLDGRGRRIVSTPPVTFFVHQGSRLINPGGGSPANGR
jgi:hypothetical protein